MTVTPPSLSMRRKFGVFRSQVRFLSPWSVACCVMIATLWIWVAFTLQSEKAEIRNRSYITAAAQARTYADQIARSIGQLDYILLSLQFHWQKNGGKLNLQEQLQAGLVPKATQISLWMFDQHGRLVPATNPHVKPNQGIESRDYFKVHAANPGRHLAISKVMRSLLRDQDVIILSRRLDAPDGSFAGLIAASVEPGFLVSFVDETNIGADGFVSIRSETGDFFATKTKSGVRTKNPSLLAVLSRTGRRTSNIGPQTDTSTERLVSSHGMLYKIIPSWRWLAFRRVPFWKSTGPGPVKYSCLP